MRKMANTNTDEMEIRKKIENTLGKNFFVEAGAGAGKTTLIVRRIVNQIMNGYKPEQLVAITYTKKAAQELYDRIQSELIKKSADPKVKKALETLELMQISTIHSFCLRILKEKAFDAGVSMDISICDESEAAAERTEFFEKWLSTLSEDKIKFLEEKSSKTSDMKKLIRNKFDEIADLYSDIVIKYKSGSDDTARNGLIDKCFAVLDDIVKELDAAVSGGTAAYGGLLSIPAEVLNNKAFREAAATAEIAGNDRIDYSDDLLKKTRSAVDTFIALKEPAKSGKDAVLFNKSKAKDNNIDSAACESMNKDAVEKIKAFADSSAYKDYQAECKKYDDANTGAAGDKRGNIATEYAVKAAEEYRKNVSSEKVTNNQLIERASELICSNEDVRAYYADKFRCIYVDEFQDTDHVQAEMIWKIACDDKGVLRDGALFIVGDPKQSIYSFRGADPQVYHEIMGRMKGCNEVLAYNFRSDDRVIKDWVNVYFKESGGNFKADTYTYTEMESQRNTAAPADRADKFICGVYRHKGDKIIDGREALPADAQNVAELINDMVNGGYVIYDGNNGVRPVNYGDFMVLFSSNKDVAYYGSVLSENGIPTDITGKMTLGGNAAVNRFIQVYNYCVSGRRDPLYRAAAQVMLSTSDKNVTEEKVKKANEVIKALKASMKGMDPYSKAEYLIEHIEFLLSDGVDISREALVKTQSKLRQLMGVVLEQCRGNRTDAAEMFVNKAYAEMEKNFTVSKAENAVALMTAHKSKGLQANIVIWAARKGTWENSTYKCMDKGQHVYWTYIDKSIESDSRNARKAENARLEYVIATRAKEAFIIMDRIPENVSVRAGDPVPTEPAYSDNYLFNDIDSKSTLKDIRDTVKASAAAVQTKAAAAEYEPVHEKNEFGKEQTENGYLVLNPSSFEDYNRKKKKDSGDDEMTAKNLRDAELMIFSDSADDEEIIDVEVLPKGAVFGVVMHRCYELLVNRWNHHFDIGRDEYMALAEKCIRMAMMESWDDIPEDEHQDWINQLKNIMLRFYGSQFKGILSGAKEIYTELAFSYYTDGTESEGLISKLSECQKISDSKDRKFWINGIADLIVRNADGSIFIIDYKSDAAGEDDTPEGFYKVLLDRYKYQLELYTHAMSRIFKVPAEKIHRLLCNYKTMETDHMA